MTKTYSFSGISINVTPHFALDDRLQLVASLIGGINAIAHAGVPNGIGEDFAPTESMIPSGMPAECLQPSLRGVTLERPHIEIYIPTLSVTDSDRHLAWNGNDKNMSLYKALTMIFGDELLTIELTLVDAGQPYHQHRNLSVYDSSDDLPF